MGDEAFHDESHRIAGWRSAFCKQLTLPEETHLCKALRRWLREARIPKRPLPVPGLKATRRGTRKHEAS